MFSKFLLEDHLLFQGKSGDCSGNNRQPLVQELKINMASDRRQTLSAFKSDAPRVTVI